MLFLFNCQQLHLDVHTLPLGPSPVSSIGIYNETIPSTGTYKHVHLPSTRQSFVSLSHLLWEESLCLFGYELPEDWI